MKINVNTNTNCREDMPKILLTANIVEYVEALASQSLDVHVINNSTRCQVSERCNVHAIALPVKNQDSYLANYIRDNKIEVVFAQGRQSLIQFFHITRQLRLPIRIVVTCHSGYVWNNILKSFIFLLLARVMSHGVMFISCRSYFQWRRFCKIIALPAWVISNPVVLARFARIAKKIRQNSIIIGSTGVVVPMKAQHILIEVLDRLIRRGYGVEIRFAGDIGNKDYWKTLREELRKRKLEKFVRWENRVAYSGIPNFLKGVDLYVCPSLCEVMPFSILEAMASSLPIIASDIGGVSDLVKNGVNGYLVKAGDVDAFEKAVMEMIDKDLLIQMGEESRHLTEELFATEKIGPRMKLMLLGG